MIDVIIICTIFGVFIMVSFGVGMNAAIKIMKGQEIKVPNLNPISVVSNSIREHQEQKDVKKEQEKLEIIAQNIDNYDGTGLGQRDIPR